MSDELRGICVEAVGSCADIPSAARENKDAVGSVEISTYDQSYIEFLDSQIALAARGLEWNERLRTRRDHLSRHVGRELARCRCNLEPMTTGFRLIRLRDPLSTGKSTMKPEEITRRRIERAEARPMAFDVVP